MKNVKKGLSESANKKIMKDLEGIQKKKKKNKNKKVAAGNSSEHSAILTENVVAKVEATKSYPKKIKKEKEEKVDVSMTEEILSNLKLSESSPAKIKKEKKDKVDVSMTEEILSNLKLSESSPAKIKKEKKDDKEMIEKLVTEEILSNPKISKSKVKKEKKEKTNVVDDSVREKILSNPKISKKKSKKQMSGGKAKKQVNDQGKGVKQKTNVKVNQQLKVSSIKDEITDIMDTEDDGDVKKIEKEAADKKSAVSVFVGNLPVNTKRDKVMKLFSKFGKVRSIRFRLSNGVKFFKSQSKVTSANVIAFVDFETEEEAKSSLVMNGEKINDNVIRVDIQSHAKTNLNFDAKRTVFVGNLKYEVTDQNLYDLFSCCGEIQYARTLQCKNGCNGVGYVCFKKAESIGMALELNNSELQGRPMRVQRYVKKDQNAGASLEKKTNAGKKEKPTGVLRRLGEKKKVKSFSKSKEQSSKAQFTGMKAKDKKKGFVKKNKKKPLKGPKLLAKRIASRDNTTGAD
ncbi:RNA-binding protein 34 [Pseudolycoriella hygida]|uniref:RNA-binding protein 34 n=1 Tax=Pseudolycoriella hygida TaxID=35572 RepID=A0A9Q0MU30_9DIPT|nr:RNA-binding protein 34 [Pseudolycoriella hygida]